MIEKSRNYKDVKCVGIDATYLEDKESFEVTLIIRDIPKQQLHLWKEKLGEIFEIDIDAS